MNAIFLTAHFQKKKTFKPEDSSCVPPMCFITSHSERLTCRRRKSTGVTDTGTPARCHGELGHLMELSHDEQHVFLQRFFLSKMFDEERGGFDATISITL